MPPPPAGGILCDTGAETRFDGWVMTRLLEPTAAPLPVPPHVPARVPGTTAAPRAPSAPPRSTHQRGGHPTLPPLRWVELRDQHPRRLPLGTPLAHHPSAPRPGSPDEPDGLPGPTKGVFGGIAVKGSGTAIKGCGTAVNGVGGAGDRRPCRRRRRRPQENSAPLQLGCHCGSTFGPPRPFVGRHDRWPLSPRRVPLPHRRHRRLRPLCTTPSTRGTTPPTRGARGTGAAHGAVLPPRRPPPLVQTLSPVAVAAAASCGRCRGRIRSRSRCPLPAARRLPLAATAEPPPRCRRCCHRRCRRGHCCRHRRALA